MKICVLGSGLRTPLLLHGLIHSGLDIKECALFDVDSERSDLMSRLGMMMGSETNLKVVPYQEAKLAIAGSDFVISSIRVGDMKTRASDERIALECGFVGQETTGPAGFAMALRTIPVALEHARFVQEVAPNAWIINFTNPAGLITQAIANEAEAKVVGVCDTPAELFLQISRALNEPLDDLQCDYFGLNHLGWVRSVRVRGEDEIGDLLRDDKLLRSIYPADLFSGELIRSLGLIPSEYLFFYYNAARALHNQRSAGCTRGKS